MILRITIPSVEVYDEIKEEFFYTKEYKLSLQHSLVSVAKWEAKWLKPFLDDAPKTREETLDYIKCMTITQNIPDSAYNFLDTESLVKIKQHIKAPMTATVISKRPGTPTNKEVYTAEVIYYWMIALNIPVEYQTWHLSRLLTLIEVCNLKNNPPKKMGRQETLRMQRDLNRKRMAKLKTKG